MSNSDVREIDEILDNFVFEIVQPFELTKEFDAHETRLKSIYKEALLDWVATVIGEDRGTEYVRTTHDNMKSVRNELRTEQRKRAGIL